LGRSAFFGNQVWPWVDALGETKVHKLPAKACYDAGKPNEIEPAASVR